MFSIYIKVTRGSKFCLSSFYYLFKSNSYINTIIIAITITVIIIIIIIIFVMLINITVVVILEKSSGGEFQARNSSSMFYPNLSR